MSCPVGYHQETFHDANGTLLVHCVADPGVREAEQRAALDRVFQQRQARVRRPDDPVIISESGQPAAQAPPPQGAQTDGPTEKTPQQQAQTSEMRRYFILGVSLILIVVALGSLK